MATHNSDVPPGIVLVVLGLLALVLLWCIFKLTKLFTWIVYRILTQPGFWVIVSLFLLAEPNTRVHGVMIVLFVIFLRCQSSSDAINNHNDGYHYYTDPVGSSHQFTSMASNVQRHSAAPWTERVTIRKANNKEFKQVKDRFTRQWKKGTCGRLKEVLLIDNPKLKSRFQVYLSSLSEPTVYRYYHGTKLQCNIYHTVSFCSDEDCGICGISQHGFLLEYKSTNIPNFQRFGDGFYLAPNSSKCHDYTQGHGYYRAMLLFDVAQGKRFIIKRNNTTLSEPPPGYDSVYGRRGTSLNYDEIVVYDPDAALPTHILIYELDGIHKIAV